MRHLHNLPVFGALGVLALFAGPVARLPIDLGAWLLERAFRGGAKSRAVPEEGR